MGKLPTTRKESLQFGLMMCFGMVLVMTIYNLYLNGMIGNMTLRHGISDFFIGFVIALALDIYLVGPIAKKVAFKLTVNTTKMIIRVLTISICMVIGMAFFMSIYGVIASYIYNGHNFSSFITDYLQVFWRNLIVALPLQIIVMGPIIRFLFAKYVKTNESKIIQSAK